VKYCHQSVDAGPASGSTQHQLGSSVCLLRPRTPSDKAVTVTTPVRRQSPYWVGTRRGAAGTAGLTLTLTLTIRNLTYIQTYVHNRIAILSPPSLDKTAQKRATIRLAGTRPIIPRLHCCLVEKLVIGSTVLKCCHPELKTLYAGVLLILQQLTDIT